jgi:ankyrin repeat protein
VKNFEGQNALHRACYYGELDVVVFLLKNTQIKFGMKDQKGNTSLHLACQGLSFAVARFIVKKVKNWREILLIENKDNNDPFDVMLESMNKIDDKSTRYTK